jgi:hypothetical protein
VTSGHIFVKGCLAGQLPRLLSFFFRLSLLFFRVSLLLFCLSLLLFSTPLPLPCLFKLLEQGFVFGYIPTSHCLSTIMPDVVTRWKLRSLQ